MHGDPQETENLIAIIKDQFERLNDNQLLCLARSHTTYGCRRYQMNTLSGHRPMFSEEAVEAFRGYNCNHDLGPLIQFFNGSLYLSSSIS